MTKKTVLMGVALFFCIGVSVLLTMGEWSATWFNTGAEHSKTSLFDRLAEPEKSPMSPNNHVKPINLEQAMKAKASSYEVRTEHLKQDGSPKYINRLILEDYGRTLSGSILDAI